MKKILILSLVFTLPINIFGLTWYHRTMDTYTLLEKYTITLDKGKKLTRIGTSEFYNLKYTVNKLFGIEKKVDVALIMEDKKINNLNANLPLSGSDYKKDAIMIIEGKTLKGKAKLRGDHYYHWGFARKSWRFKTSKKNIHQGINKFNLIIPKSTDMLLNHLSYKLAKTMGLLAPDSKLVDFSLNGVYKGPRLLVEQIDESFLRKNNRMPNDIYKGDNIGQSKYIGVDVLLFENPSIWEKSAYNNHYPEQQQKPLEKLINQIYHNEYSIYDLESFAKMAAYIDLVGSYHHDRSHNWFLLFDNYLEKMVPIIWDTIGWTNYTVQLENYNITTSELLLSLYNNYDFVRLKNKALLNFYKYTNKTYLNILNTEINESKKIINSNQLSFDMDRTLYNQEQALKHLDEFEQKITQRFERVHNYFLSDLNENNYRYTIQQKVIRFSFNGSLLCNGIDIKLNNEEKPTKILISYLQSGELITKDITNLTIIKDSNISIEIELLANMIKADSYKGTVKKEFTPVTYDLELQGVNTDNIERVSLKFATLPETTLKIGKVTSIDQIAFNEDLKNIFANTKKSKALKWSGEKHFTGFNLIKDDIKIKQGTKLIFDEGAVLKVLGKVTAIGSEQLPITFQALNNTKPWGAFALKGKAANGSIFQHVIFKNGSGHKGDLHEYTAMLSIHNVKGVLIDNSQFYDSKITDDMVHIVYSEVKLQNTKFVRSKSDALDVDISNVTINNCEFIDSGNDAIDLMTSNALVTNSQFINSADKGISIGEGSNLLAINNLIANNLIGMQSKDTSLAYIYNSSFINNKKAIDAYHKNWRYSKGGTIYLDKIKLLGNEINATADKESQVIINDSSIDTPDNFKPKKIRKNKIIISDQEVIPYNFDHPFLQGHDDLINKYQKGYHE